MNTTTTNSIPASPIIPDGTFHPLPHIRPAGGRDQICDGGPLSGHCFAHTWAADTHHLPTGYYQQSRCRRDGHRIWTWHPHRHRLSTTSPRPVANITPFPATQS